MSNGKTRQHSRSGGGGVGYTKIIRIHDYSFERNWLTWIGIYRCNQGTKPTDFTWTLFLQAINGWLETLRGISGYEKIDFSTPVRGKFRRKVIRLSCCCKCWKFPSLKMHKFEFSLHLLSSPLLLHRHLFVENGCKDWFVILKEATCASQ